MPRLTNGLEQVLTNLGIVGSGYKLFFFETGTTTLKTTYSDEDLTIANTNPIVLNSAGRPNVDVWGFDPSLYRMILGTPDSIVGNITTVVDVDPIDNYQIDNVSSLNPIPTAYWGTTAGSSTAYTLEEPLVDISLYSNAQTFFIDIHIACGDNPTFKAKDLDAISLQKYKGDGTTTNLVANDLQNQRYLCINNGTNIIVLNPEKPFFSGENIFEANLTTRGVSFLSKPNNSVFIANNSSDANNDIDFIEGVVSFSDGSGQIKISTITKQLDTSWAEGNNQGGLFSGSKANDTKYSCFIIYNTTTKTYDAGFDTDADGSNIPAGYTSYKRVGSIKTDSSGNIIGFIQAGNFFFLKKCIVERGMSASPTTPENLTLSTPKLNTLAIVNIQLDDLTGTNSGQVLLVDPEYSDLNVSSSNFTARIEAPGTDEQSNTTGNLFIRTNTDSEISIDSTNAQVGLEIITYGWVDYSL